MSAIAFRNLLSAGDVDGVRAHWASVAPNMPQPENREQAEVAMHYARTQAESVPFDKRAWSHRWLCERDLPSGLPDKLKPNAEQVCPREVDGVGISVNVRNPWLKPVAIEARQAMELAVEDCYANGDKAPAIVQARMKEARDKVWRSLVGFGRG